jgi:hypothetical protein
MRPESATDFMPPWRWGIFLRKPCASLLIERSSPDFEPMQAIYNALKSVGFRETYWQFVFPGQIGGLVKSPGSQLAEHHVRFFEGGMIYAEFELGRSALIHFLGHRYYLNHYIARKIRKKLSPAHFAYLQEAVERYKFQNHRDWPEWSADRRFMTPRIKSQLRFLTILSDWRVLASVMLASVVATMIHGPIILPIIVALLILVYLLAPRRT